MPLPKKDYNLFCWKLSKRYDQDISTISLTVYIKIRDQIIDDIHLAAGGIAETPKYLDNLCKDMKGQKLDKSISLAINNIKNYIYDLINGFFINQDSEYLMGEYIKNIFNNFDARYSIL